MVEMPGRPTSRKPFEKEGLRWVSRQTHINDFTTFVEGDPSSFVRFTNPVFKSTYSATANGSLLGNRYREEYTAMRAIAKALKSSAP